MYLFLLLAQHFLFTLCSTTTTPYDCNFLTKRTVKSQLSLPWIVLTKRSTYFFTFFKILCSTLPLKISSLECMDYVLSHKVCYSGLQFPSLVFLRAHCISFITSAKVTSFSPLKILKVGRKEEDIEPRNLVQ